MAKLHMKGFILRLLNDNASGLWDYQIADAVLKEYNHKGDYWKAEVRSTLNDLFSGALIEEQENNLDNGEHFATGKLLMKFRLTRFGKDRMRETGIL